MAAWKQGEIDAARVPLRRYPLVIGAVVALLALLAIGHFIVRR